MHAAILHYQVLRILQYKLILGLLREMRQINSEKIISLLVAVLQFVWLQHYHSIGQVVKNLSDRVARLLRLHLHHEELGNHASNWIAGEEHQHRPQGHLDYRIQYLPVQVICLRHFYRKDQRYRGEHSKKNVQKWCQENTYQQILVYCELPRPIDDFIVPDLFLRRQMAHILFKKDRIIRATDYAANQWLRNQQVSRTMLRLEYMKSRRHGNCKVDHD